MDFIPQERQEAYLLSVLLHPKSERLFSFSFNSFLFSLLFDMKRAPEAPAPVSGAVPVTGGTPQFICQVCSQKFSSQGGLACHLRDKQDVMHKQSRSDPGSCETAQKRPRTRSAAGGGCGETGGARSDEANEDKSRCSGTADASAGDPGIAKKIVQSLAQGFTSLQRAFAPSTSSHNDVGPQERSPTPPVPPSAPGGAVKAQMPSQERAEQEKTLVQQNIGLREKLTQLEALSRRLEAEKEEVLSTNRRIKTENENLHVQLKAWSSNYSRLKTSSEQRLEKMRQENSVLRQTIDEWRAERAAAAAGNDNINSNFPFKQDIVNSYGTLTNASGILWALLDPCIDAEDIPLACGVCKEIFTTCSGFARTMVEEPKDRFKETVMVGEGGKDVQEWEDARVHMTKVQRATRERLVSQEEGRVKELVDLWLQDHGHVQAVKRLALLEGFKEEALRTCIVKLLQVALRGRETAVDSEREREGESERVFVLRCLRWCLSVCHNKLCDLRNYPILVCTILMLLTVMLTVLRLIKTGACGCGA
jgi:hypothetical protein